MFPAVASTPGIMAATRAKIIRLATYKTMNSIKNFFIFCCFNNKIQFNNHCRRFRQIRRRLSITAGVRGEKSPVGFLLNRLSVAGGAFLSVHSLPFFRGNEFLAEQEVGHVSDFPGQRIFHPATVFLVYVQMYIHFYLLLVYIQ